MSEFDVKQLFVGGFDDNLSYVVYAGSNGDTAVVDPCGDVDLIIRTIKQFPDMHPRYILLTHGHHDHTSGVKTLNKYFDAPVAMFGGSDLKVEDHQYLPFGSGFIEVLHAPGHTRDSVIYRLSDDSAIFTGDTLFVDYIGYCQAETMFNTLRKVVVPLADSNIVYSGHDYGREPCSPLGVEKHRNPYLAADSFEQFKLELKNL